LFFLHTPAIFQCISQAAEKKRSFVYRLSNQIVLHESPLPTPAATGVCVAAASAGLAATSAGLAATSAGLAGLAAAASAGLAAASAGLAAAVGLAVAAGIAAAAGLGIGGLGAVGLATIAGFAVALAVGVGAEDIGVGLFVVADGRTLQSSYRVEAESIFVIM
jgi:hypothetical protein